MARQGLLEWNNVGLGLTKWGLIVFNVAFWFLGIVSLAIGLWLYVTRNEYATFSEGEYLLGSVFLIATGFGIIIVGFLGIGAAIWESTIIATFFGILITIAFGMFMTCGIWSFVKEDDLNSQLERHLFRTADMYESVEAYRSVWDHMHDRFNCCGINSPQDWEELNPLRLTAPPSSCCRDRQCTQLYQSGCVSSLHDYERRQLDIMGPIGVAFGLFQIFGILLCILFCVTSRNAKETYYT